MMRSSLFLPYLLLVSGLLWPLVSGAQAPGGVSTNLQAWFKADDAAFASGSFFTIDWPDASMNGNDGTYNGGSSYSIISDKINFNPAVQLNNEHFEVPVNLNAPHVHVFTIHRLDQDADLPIWGDGTTPINNRQVLTKSYRNGSGGLLPHTNASVENKTYLHHIELGTPNNVLLIRRLLSINTNNPVDTTTYFYLGGSHPGNLYTSSNLSSGDELHLAECIVYTSNTSGLNSTQIQQIQSYLALKHGLTLNQLYRLSTGLNVWIPNSHIGYGNRIFGVVEDAGSGLRQVRSRSEEEGSYLTLTPHTLTDLIDGTALIVGDNDRPTNTVAASTPIINNWFLGQAERMERVWSVQNTGNLASTDGFDLTFSSTIPRPTGFQRHGMVVLVSNDANFRLSTRAYPLERVGTEWIAQNVVLNDGEFFTIAQPMTSLWAKADASNNTISSNRVDRLNNQLYQINHLIGQDVSGGSDKPNYRNASNVDSLFNFHPYIRFNDNGEENYLHVPSYKGWGGHTGSVFMVARRAGVGVNLSSEALFSYSDQSGSNGANDWVISDPTDLRVTIQDQNSGPNYGFDLTNDRPALITSLVDISSGVDRVSMGYNGLLATQSQGGANPIATRGSLVLGQEQDSNGGGFTDAQQWEGDFAEIIALNRIVIPQERDYVETYLALKYGITLAGSYAIPDAFFRPLPVWDASHAGGIYHHRVTGVGNLPQFGWTQTKSQNQSETQAYLTLENANVPNEGVLVVGDNDGDFDAVTAMNSPGGVYTSDRIWYVRKSNTSVGGVDLTFKRPIGMNGQSNIRLLISRTSSFQSSHRRVPGRLVNGKLVFSNVTLNDGEYFCIGEERLRFFVNQDTLWPGTFEACPGDQVEFYYYDFTLVPDEVIFSGSNGPITVPVQSNSISSQTSTSPILYTGHVVVTVPPDAVTGDVSLIANGIPIFQYPEQFIVQNPELFMFAETNPICASDSIQLNARPEGGTFWGVSGGFPMAADPSVINSTGLIMGPFAGWSTLNDNERQLIVRYDYQPKYSNDVTCGTIVSLLDTFTIRDNRLDLLQFRSVYPRNGSNTYPLLLDSSVITQIVPDLLDPSFQPYNFPIRFYGTYAEDTFGVFNFRATQGLNGRASNNTKLTLRYDNGGCIGEFEGDIWTYESARILGLPDTLCGSAQPVVIMRDTSPIHSETPANRDSSSFRSGPYLYTYYTQRNRVTQVRIVNPAFQSALPMVDSTLSRERFSLNPQSLPPGEVVVEMQYETITTIVRTDSRVASGALLTTYDSFYYPVFDTVTILPRPVLSLHGLEPVYCAQVDADSFRVSPPFESSPRTRFSVVLTDTSGPSFSYTINDTLGTPLVVSPRTLYERHRPDGVYNLNFYVTYTVERYGCLDEIRDTAFIRQPLQPRFYHDTSYCLSNGIERLGTNSASLGRPGYFTARSGLDANGDMNTALLGAGYHAIEFNHRDNQGCSTFFIDTLYVQPPPDVDLYIDNSRAAAQFCASDDPVRLSFVLQNGGALDSIQYTGSGVFGDTLRPSQINVNGGTFSVLLTVIDSFECRGFDSLFFTVERAPILDLSVAFNNRATTLSNGIPIPHAYCHNHPDIVVRASPYHVDSNNIVRGSFTGRGIYTIGDSIYYSPNLVPEGSVDTIVYTYTTAEGCTGMTLTYIQIDTIPDASLTGLQPTYCSSLDTLHLTGFPNPSLGRSGGNTIFGGLGLDRNGVLDFANAPVGQVIYFYQFEDDEFCVGIDRDTVFISPGPSANFSGFNNRRAYCRDAAPEQWISLNDTTAPSFFYFSVDSGLVFIDSSGLFTPDPSYGALPNSTLVGSHEIRYTYADTNGCADSKTVNIYIHPTPRISLAGLDSAYCLNASPGAISMSQRATLDLLRSAPHFRASNNILTFVPNTDTAGIKPYALTYTDSSTLCSDTIQGYTRVFLPSTPSFVMDTSYCETNAHYALDTLGFPFGGVFAGPGVDSVTFIPIRAGEGQHTIRYTVQDTFQYGPSPADSLVCRAVSEWSFFVRPIPEVGILTPFDGTAFCSDNAPQLLEPLSMIDTSSRHVFYGNGVLDTIRIAMVLRYVPALGRSVLLPDTVPAYYFEPNILGNNDVQYRITNVYGCSDSTTYNYSVQPGFNRPLFSLDSIFCTSDDSTLLVGPTGTNIFTINGDTLGAAPYYVPSRLNFVSTYVFDTVTLSSTNTACRATDTVVVTLFNSPASSFQTADSSTVFCLGMDPIVLVPDVTGGVFSGDGVRSGSTIFEPQIVNAGTQTVRYTITDTVTQCVSETERTFYVYGQPAVSYQSIGGCQNDTVQFLPDTVVLGLGNFQAGRLVDSITSVQWVLNADTTVQGVLDSNRVLPLSFIYRNKGVYQTQLIVSNRGVCVDTHDVRLVISPMVTNFPYVEDFEDDDGGYYAEARTATHDLLWEWGIDSTASGVQGNHNNHIWSTGLNHGYDILEDAWVYPPCFDIGLLSRPMIKLDYWSDTRYAADGVVIEFQLDDGTWLPLGELDRGINWYDTDLIGGRPGNQVFAPMGWSGIQNSWIDGRYKLDDVQRQVDRLRLRVAFGASDVPLNRTYDGFAFDNFTIQNRTRNVLLETTSNYNGTGMELINKHIYELIFDMGLVKDVILTQNHTQWPSNDDEFYKILGNSPRVGVTGNMTPGAALIDGDTVGASINLRVEDFEQEMLKTPYFEISIDSFENIYNTFYMVVTVKALEAQPLKDYRIHTLVIEDSLYYSKSKQVAKYSSQMYGVTRQDNDGFSPFSMRKAWQAGETKTVRFEWNHNLTYRPNRFQAVAFIYSPEDREVLQAATTRDASGYLVNVNTIQAQSQYNEISTMTLFPNPAQDAFNVRFDQPLSTDYQWKLVDLRGIEIQTGTAEAGTELMTIENQDYPSGTYLLLLHNDQVFAQRKVILRR